MTRRCLQHVEWHLVDTPDGSYTAWLYHHMNVQPSIDLPPTAETWILFFDGGARGNPGPGGSGAVILHATLLGYHLIWIGCAYHQPPTTNNTAEFSALRAGLAQAARLGLRRLHVVGDSQMIIRLFIDHRVSNAPHLRTIYNDIVQLIDTFDSIQWRHHVRAYNKMADAAANGAVDTNLTTATTSTTPSGLYQAVQPHQLNDVSQWSADHDTMPIS